MDRWKYRCGAGLGLAGLLLGGAALSAAPGPRPAGPPEVDYARDIQPIFAARCYACHGPKLQRNGLRLDSKSHALQGGDTGRAILPGKGAESDLVHRVTTRDPKRVMPPAGAPLTPAEVELLRTWIDQGAKWPDDPRPAQVLGGDHWAFRPVRRPAVPKVKGLSWVRNPIDAFILAKLEQKGLRPSPEADRVTLIRRLSLDLLGLPPSVEEVDTFLRDSRPDAYERLVDRLLASPHYGERWGRHWLDVARYADSNGYTIDSARQMWKYRDWVIEALNRDLPFDQFTIEQLAGDMLPKAAESQVIATGFHRNTLFNEEGGTDREQFRVEAVVDRVNTTGAVWLGLTVGCAQCHTHKYDPITQKEYYQLFAFFNNADEPAVTFPTPEQARRQQQIREQTAAVQRDLAEYDRTLDRRQAAWEARAGQAASAAWKPLAGARVASAAGAPIRELEDGSFLVGEPVPENDTYTVVADAVPGITAIRLDVLTHDSLPGGGPGWARGNFLLTEFALSASPTGAAESVPVPIASAVADHAQKDYPVANALDGKPGTGWAINVAAGEGRLNTSRTALFFLKEPLAVAPGAKLTLALKQEHPNKRYLIGRFRLSFSTAPVSGLELPLPEAVRALIAIPPGARSKAQQDELAQEFRKRDTERAALAGRLASLQAEEKELAKALPTALVMKERDTPRESYVHIRGDFLRKGDPVRPAVPAVLPALPPDVPNPTRLDFARWLVDPKNPLTPRVAVNRVWQQYFGTGLVETENDFGKQGTPPSHPELLDYLAARFAGVPSSEVRVPSSAPANSEPGTRNPELSLGWSLKRLHRLIVTSATYRQSSRARPDLAEVDPRNRLLARQSRLRLDAEVIRDVSLAATGLLSPKIGGPSVYPPQPAGLDAFTQTKKNWKPSEGEDRYRRGLYTFFWRSNPYAMFQTFDAPNGNVTCTRRTRSNTPLGALMLANDQSVFEMARALAGRLLREGSNSDTERARLAFRRCLSREPSAAELKRLVEYYEAQVRGFQAAPKEAGAVAPAGLPAETDPARAAAWTAVARVLLNLDEFITRE